LQLAAAHSLRTISPQFFEATALAAPTPSAQPFGRKSTINRGDHIMAKINGTRFGRAC
jgi:hypothetical protein